jgi:hypothetical protein
VVGTEKRNQAYATAELKSGIAVVAIDGIREFRVCYCGDYPFSKRAIRVGRGLCFLHEAAIPSPTENGKFVWVVNG